MQYTREKLIPPFRFAFVEDNLFRGAYPTSRNFRFMRRLSLKTVVSIIPNPPKPHLQQFCMENSIRICYFHATRFKEEVPLSHDVVASILSILVDADNLPLYLHCPDGTHMTGIIVMCLRKLQNWNLSVTFTEFARFLKDYNVDRSSQYEFVESFCADVLLPPRIPPWLWGGRACVVHPSLNIVISDAQQEAMGRKKGERRERDEESPAAREARNLSRAMQALALEPLHRREGK